MSRPVLFFANFKFRWFLILVLFSGKFLSAQSVKISTYKLNDATRAIEIAIKSSNDTVIIDIQGKPIYVRPMRFQNINNKVIVLEKGTQMIAQSGAFLNKTDAMMSFIDCSDISIIGNDAELLMNKKEYVEGEWRHVLSFRGSTNISLKSLVLKDSGGDGIYLAGSKSKPYCENILIDSVKSINNKRQGISIISAKSVVIKNSLFSETSGTLPGAGLDIEPNRPEDIISDIEVLYCVFQNNYGAGIKIELHKLNSDSSDVSILFRHCVIRANTSQEHPRVHAAMDFQANKLDPVKGEVFIEDCVFEDSEWGLLYSRKRTDAYSVTFKNCTLRNMNKSKASSIIYLEVPDYKSNLGDLGGFTFDNLHISDTEITRLLKVRGSRLGTLKSLRDVKIELIMEQAPRNLVEYIKYDPANNVNVNLEIINRK